jgi:cytochrome oxidase Cu insertion factor (SCO1/SenC/PrrC family)
MSVIWGNVEAVNPAIVVSVDPEHPDPRAPRGYYESLTDWVCRFTDVRLDSHRMGEIARDLTA